MGNTQAKAESKRLLAMKIQEEANKALVTAFYQEVICCKNTDPIDEYISSSQYVEHHPGMGDGPKELKACFKSWFSNLGEFFHQILHVAADGDLVFVHVKCMAMGRNSACIDIFRVENGKIVEHWDVIQDVPQLTANSHPMF